MLRRVAGRGEKPSHCPRRQLWRDVFIESWWPKCTGKRGAQGLWAAFQLRNRIRNRPIEVFLCRFLKCQRGSGAIGHGPRWRMGRWAKLVAKVRAQPRRATGVVVAFNRSAQWTLALDFFHALRRSRARRSGRGGRDFGPRLDAIGFNAGLQACRQATWPKPLGARAEGSAWPLAIHLASEMHADVCAPNASSRATCPGPRWPRSGGLRLISACSEWPRRLSDGQSA